MPTKMRDCCMYARTPCGKLEIKHIPDSSLPPSTGFTYRVTNDTDGVASRQSSQSNTEAAGQVHEAVEQTVLHIRWRLHVSGDKNCDHQGIHSNNTRHDDWDERLLMLAVVQLADFLCTHLHDEVGPEGTDTCDTNARLGRAVCCSYACSAS
jgi:hypothetical protein